MCSYDFKPFFYKNINYKALKSLGIYCIFEYISLWTGQLALGIYRDIYCIYATHTVGLYFLVPDQEDQKLLRGWVGVRGVWKVRVRAVGFKQGN
jgi:hypothetical protein